MQSNKTYQTHVYAGTVWNIYNHASGMNYDSVDSIFELIDASFCKSSRLLSERLELRLRSNPSNNKLLSRFQKQLRREIEKLNHHGHPVIFEFIWAREQVSSEYPHYHCTVIVNGNVFLSNYRIFRLAKRIWNKLTNGFVPYIARSFYRLTLDDPWTLQQAIYRISYLSKKEGKAHNKPYRHFGSTNSKPNANSPWRHSFANDSTNVELFAQSIESPHLKASPTPFILYCGITFCRMSDNNILNQGIASPPEVLKPP